MIDGTCCMCGQRGAAGEMCAACPCAYPIPRIDGTTGKPRAWCKCGDGFAPNQGGASADECVNCIFGKGEA